jgi:polyferredoxin
MIRSRVGNGLLCATGTLFVVYAVALMSVAAERHALSNAGVLHCLVVGGLGSWMAIGTARNLRRKEEVDLVSSRWDRRAAALLAIGAVAGVLTWITWYLRAPWAVVYTLWAVFLASFFGILLLLAIYAVAKSGKHR